MGFDFTIAITPDKLKIDREIQYAKAALLYADNITLISPFASFCHRSMYNARGFDREKIEKLLSNIVQWLKDRRTPEEESAYQIALELKNSIVDPETYAKLSVHDRDNRKKAALLLGQYVDDSMSKRIGTEQFSDLKKLDACGKVVIKEFESDFTDGAGLLEEYTLLLKEALYSSYPLFDENSNWLMAETVESKIIRLSPTERRKITHAGFSDNIVARLPSFDQATVDEILDIRKELEPSISRFRSKMISYSDTLQTMPWDKDFEAECSMLYDQEVAPAITEIDERSRDNSFLKNLGGKLFMDKDFMTTAGQLAISVAAGGVIQKFAETGSMDPALVTAGGVWAAQKLKSAYDEYAEKKKEIQRKDLYFYYQAGKKLSK